jgi:hypothetical protein
MEQERVKVSELRAWIDAAVRAWKRPARADA